MRLLTPPGVFRPLTESWLLADAVRDAVCPGDRLLDLCTGTGIAGVSGARAGAEVTAVDISRRAVRTAWANAVLNGVWVRSRRGSLFDAVVGQRFDCIASNPPYVPSERPGVVAVGAARAWEGGPDGRVHLDELCRRAVDHLEPGGCVLLVHSHLVGEQRTLDLLAESGLEAGVVRRVREPLGPLMRSRRDAGVLPPGTEAEDVIVVRGLRAS